MSVSPHAATTRPGGVMVFDGVCHLCSRAVRTIAAMDRDGVISFAPIQSSYGTMLANTYGVDANNPLSFLFVRDGRGFQDSDAVIQMLKCLRLPWRWLSFMSIFPRTWRDAAYRWVARNRYRLFGKSNQCMVPSSRLRSRFVDTPPAG